MADIGAIGLAWILLYISVSRQGAGKTKETTMQFKTKKEAIESGLTGHLIHSPSYYAATEPSDTEEYFEIKDISGNPNWTLLQNAGRLLGWVENKILTPIRVG